MSNDAGLGYLFEDTRWGTVSANFQLAIPKPDQVSNVNIVPFIDEQVIIVRLEDGSYEVPGGTREAGETYLDAVRRELLEEAGARLIDYVPFGAWRCYSSNEKPYKPHLPHPEFYRLVGYGEVELIARPTNPADGEQVAAVEVVTVEAAAAKFSASGRPDLADLYDHPDCGDGAGDVSGALPGAGAGG
jgi:8-oxo-dGTP pyrophosphatase MutT (NUDIX family)